MTAIFHALQIGTLACWLSVGGFGVVALAVPGLPRPPSPAQKTAEIQPVSEIFTLGETEVPQTSSAVSSEAPPEITPLPPEMPEIPEFSPLPEIPEIPSAAATVAAALTPPTASPARLPSPKPPSAAAKSGTRRKSSASAENSSDSEASEATRLAQGRMPKPSYPAQAKRAGQAGTVVVEFTVDASGRVISAYAKSSSGWPLLDAEAARTVRRWTFPGGGVMKLQRPIVFQLR